MLLGILHNFRQLSSWLLLNIHIFRLKSVPAETKLTRPVVLTLYPLWFTCWSVGCSANHQQEGPACGFFLNRSKSFLYVLSSGVISSNPLPSDILISHVSPANFCHAALVKRTREWRRAWRDFLICRIHKWRSLSSTTISPLNSTFFLRICPLAQWRPKL